MGKLNKKFAKFDNPTITFFVIMLVYHMLANINYGDDVSYFQNVLAGSQDYIGDTIRFSVERYHIWSSRTIIEIFVIYLVHLPHIVWRILDTMMWMLLYSSMINLLDIKTDKMRWSIVILLLLFPFKYTGTAGWICTSLNYTWPTALGLYFFAIVQKWRMGTPASIVTTISALLALVYAANEEQMSAVLFMVLSVILLHDISKKHVNKVVLISYTITCVMMVYILTCPGNGARLASAVLDRIPGYMEYSILEKLDLGFVNLVNSYFQTFNIISVLLCILVYRQYNFNDAIRIFLKYVIIWSILCQIVVKLGIWPELAEIHGVNDINAFLVVQYIMPLTAIIFLIYALGKISYDRYCNGSLAGIFCLGLVSAMIMGFSPTVYASGPRTFIFLFMCSIYLIGCLMSELNKIKLSNYLRYLSIVTLIIVIRTIYMVAYKQ